jgi:hypothetical protein
MVFPGFCGELLFTQDALDFVDAGLNCFQLDLDASEPIALWRGGV